MLDAGGTDGGLGASSANIAADARGVLGVMGLGATSGQQVTVSAGGPDAAAAAVAVLVTILADATRVGG